MNMKFNTNDELLIFCIFFQMCFKSKNRKTQNLTEFIFFFSTKYYSKCKNFFPSSLCSSSSSSFPPPPRHGINQCWVIFIFLSKLINSKFYMMLWKPNQFSYIYRASENWLGFQVRISNSPNFYMMLSKPDQLSLSLSLSLSLTHTHTHILD